MNSQYSHFDFKMFQLLTVIPLSLHITILLLHGKPHQTSCLWGKVAEMVSVEVVCSVCLRL